MPFLTHYIPDKFVENTDSEASFNIPTHSRNTCIWVLGTFLENHVSNELIMGVCIENIDGLNDNADLTIFIS